MLRNKQQLFQIMHYYKLLRKHTCYRTISVEFENQLRWKISVIDGQYLSICLNVHETNLFVWLWFEINPFIFTAFNQAFIFLIQICFMRYLHQRSEIHETLQPNKVKQFKGFDNIS